MLFHVFILCLCRCCLFVCTVLVVGVLESAFDPIRAAVCEGIRRLCSDYSKGKLSVASLQLQSPARFFLDLLLSFLSLFSPSLSLSSPSSLSLSRSPSQIKFDTCADYFKLIQSLLEDSAKCARLFGAIIR